MHDRSLKSDLIVLAAVDILVHKVLLEHFLSQVGQALANPESFLGLRKVDLSSNNCVAVTSC